MLKRIFFLAEVEIPSSKIVEETEDLEDNSDSTEKRLYNGSQGSLTEIEENNLPLNVSSMSSMLHISRVWSVLLVLLQIY